MNTNKALRGMLIAFVIMLPISYLLTRYGEGLSVEKSLFLSLIFSIVIVAASTLLIWICWKFVSIFLQTGHVASVEKMVEEQRKNTPVSIEKKIFNPNSFLALLIGSLALLVLVYLIVTINDFILEIFLKDSDFFNQTIFVPSARIGTRGHDSSVHLVLAIILGFIEIKLFLWRPFKKLMQKIGIYR